jgi:pyruvate formate-lyase activating enzyme-like uncharacterized protein
MIIDLDQTTLSKIKNPVFLSYASMYAQIYADFMAQVAQTGIGIDPQDDRARVVEKIQALGQKGALVRNDAKSVYINRISPACEACQTGMGSATFFISLKCHRNCFYCFNPNQEGYEHYKLEKRDLVQELSDLQAQRQKLAHIALTGGEPLLFKEETLNFFRAARQKFPHAYTRLYTCGDHLDKDTFQQLHAVSLDEIRFSIRLHDLEKGHREVFTRLAVAREYIPNVMVEMPVLPGNLDMMKEILRELDRLEIFGINLLEFCYPYANTDVYREKSYQVKNHPYRVLYNYWYGGGLPIARSEQDCLDLIEYAFDEKLRIGVHYCSLENKHTGQIYQQNGGQKPLSNSYFSKKDYFLKTAKVFGEDIPKAVEAFRARHYDRYQLDRERNYLEFHVGRIKDLPFLDMEVGVSSSVIEVREGESYIRELKLDYTTPSLFDLVHDV